MDPVNVTKQGVDLANRYGLATVLAIVAIGILAWLIWYTMTKNNDREIRVAKENLEREDKLVEIIRGQGVALTGLTTSINNLNNRIESAQVEHQNRHQSLLNAANYCREENKEIIAKSNKILEEVMDRDCKAK